MDISAMTKADAYTLLNQLSAHAAAKKDDELVHITGADGQRRTVVPAEGDRIRGLFTWTAPGRNVGANNATRNALASALVTIFGAEDIKGLPPKVQDALKVSKFDGTGRPLSVRRIKAVISAVRKEGDYQTFVKGKVDEICSGASADQKDRIDDMMGGTLSERTIAKDLGVDPEMATGARFHPRESYDDGNFVVFDMEGGNGATAKVAVGRDGGMHMVQLAADGASYEFVMPDGEILDAADFKLDMSLGGVGEASRKAIRGALSPSERQTLQFLASMMDEENFGEDTNTKLTFSSLRSSMVNMFFDAVKAMRGENRAGLGQQENFAAVWKHLGLSGDAPSMEDRDLSSKFISAMAERVATDICGMMEGCTLDEVKSAMPRSKSDHSAPVGMNPNVFPIQGRLKNLGQVVGFTYSGILKKHQDPGHMPGTDELFFKPSGTKVPATKLARVGDNKDGVLSGVDAAIKNYAGRTKRYVDAKVGIGEGNDIVWLDLGKSAEEVGKQYEEAMRKKGCTDAQMVRSIGVLNDMNFFADLGFNSLKNIQTVITPMEGGEVKVRHEVPMAGAPGGKAYDEILVDKDGGYRMEGCGVA